MKKLIIVLAVLVAVFIGVWTVKLREPLTPVDPYAGGLSGERPWWETNNGEVPQPDEEWVLDYTVPENYIPVLGGEELYMEIDPETGEILRYRQRVQQEDGTWVWETVDPNIPDNYEPVPGLENVYKVTGPDGVVHYYKYTRNPDDTYFFTEVDEHGNPIKSDALTDDEIPANYIRIEGTNIYAVYNEHGVLVGYKERVQNADGTYSWVDADPPRQSGGSPQQGSGAIPNIGGNSTNQGAGGTADGQVNITGGDIHETNRGYTDEQIHTDVKRENGWVIVYETVVTNTYNEAGDLLSTKSDGPNEINRFPETEANESVIQAILNGERPAS